MLLGRWVCSWPRHALTAAAIVLVRMLYVEDALGELFAREG